MVQTHQEAQAWPTMKQWYKKESIVFSQNLMCLGGYYTSNFTQIPLWNKRKTKEHGKLVLFRNNNNEVTPLKPPTKDLAFFFLLGSHLCSCRHETGRRDMHLQIPSHPTNSNSLPEFPRMSPFSTNLFLFCSLLVSIVFCTKAMFPSLPFKSLNLVAFIQFLSLYCTVFIVVVHLTLSNFFCGCEHY